MHIIINFLITIVLYLLYFIVRLISKTHLLVNLFKFYLIFYLIKLNSLIFLITQNCMLGFLVERLTNKTFGYLCLL